jgi:uncharacterized LabA/DUF88 family protein
MVCTVVPPQSAKISDIILVVRNAADRLMKSHAMDLSHRCKSIAIVSADTGFAETVQHCRSMDCQVIVIGV